MENKFVNELRKQSNMTKTQNNENTYTTSLNHNLDLFGQVGGMRGQGSRALEMFKKAYRENKNLAVRNLFYLRDIRGGIGERELARTLFSVIVDDNQEQAAELLKPFVEFGRWDDVVEILYRNKGKEEFVKAGFNFIKDQLNEDVSNSWEGNSVSLLAKWLPSEGASSKRTKEKAKFVMSNLGLDPRTYRKVLSALRKDIKLTETALTERDYGAIELDRVPSQAFLKYLGAFYRNMPEATEAYFEAVNSGEKKINMDTVTPNQIVRLHNDYHSNYSDDALQAMWDNLKDTIGDTEDNILPMIDVSGSMIGQPMEVAVGLGIYVSERLEGAFKDVYLSFSAEPRLYSHTNKDFIGDKIDGVMQSGWGMNTNLERAFDLLLSTAVRNSTAQSELPSKLLILSDMEFDEATSGTHGWWNNSEDLPDVNETFFKKMRHKYHAYGYKLPQVVFWNIDSKQNNMPVQYDENGVALVSGFSTNILKFIVSGELTSPEDMMLEVLQSERYDVVDRYL